MWFAKFCADRGSVQQAFGGRIGETADGGRLMVGCAAEAMDAEAVRGSVAGAVCRSVGRSVGRCLTTCTDAFDVNCHCDRVYNMLFFESPHLFKASACGHLRYETYLRTVESVPVIKYGKDRDRN